MVGRFVSGMALRPVFRMRFVREIPVASAIPLTVFVELRFFVQSRPGVFFGVVRCFTAELNSEKDSRPLYGISTIPVRKMRSLTPYK